MGSPTAQSHLLSNCEWNTMQFHVRTYLAGHPLLRGLEVRTEADAEGLTAELHYSKRCARSAHRCPEWWKPTTAERGREIAEELARELHRQWFQLLRRQ